MFIQSGQGALSHAGYTELCSFSQVKVRCHTLGAPNCVHSACVFCHFVKVTKIETVEVENAVQEEA